MASGPVCRCCLGGAAWGLIALFTVGASGEQAHHDIVDGQRLYAGASWSLVGFRLGVLALSPGAVLYYWFFAPIVPLVLAAVIRILQETGVCVRSPKAPLLLRFSPSQPVHVLPESSRMRAAASDDVPNNASVGGRRRWWPGHHQMSRGGRPLVPLVER